VQLVLRILQISGAAGGPGTAANITVSKQVS